MLIAVAALVIAGAVPALAAPGGVPGPPNGHGKATVTAPAVADEMPDMDDEVGEMPDMDAPPAWAKAYGWRIKNEYGMTYGHLRICATGNEKAQENLECSEFDPPEGFEDAMMDEHGAGGFWVALNGEVAKRIKMG